VPGSVRGKDVDFEVHPTRLRLAVQGDTLLEGGLQDAGAIAVDSESHHKTGGATYVVCCCFCLDSWGGPGGGGGYAVLCKSL